MVIIYTHLFEKKKENNYTPRTEYLLLFEVANKLIFKENSQISNQKTQNMLFKKKIPSGFPVVVLIIEKATIYYGGTYLPQGKNERITGWKKRFQDNYLRISIAQGPKLSIQA